MIEELNNFQIKKNFCIECLDQLIKKRKKSNKIILQEKQKIENSIDSLNNEIESYDFSKKIFYKTRKIYGNKFR